MQHKLDKRFGIIKYNDTYYKSCAIFTKEDFYSDEEKEALGNNKTNQDSNIKKFYVPCVNADFNVDIKAE